MIESVLTVPKSSCQALQAMESAWQSTKTGSLLPVRLVGVVEALQTLPMTYPKPEAQAHHVASAVILALCLPSKSGYELQDIGFPKNLSLSSG